MNGNAFPMPSEREAPAPWRGWQLPWRRSGPPTQTAGQLRASVREKVRQGDYAGAIPLLDRLISRHPDSARDYNNRGLMYFYQGQLSRAMADYNRAIELDPQLDSAYNNRANCHAAVGNLDAALRDYEMTLDLNPGNLRALVNQGITLRDLGLLDWALEKFELALLLGRSLKGCIYAERGYTYHLGGDWNCAVADYRRSLLYLTSESPYQQKVKRWLGQLLGPLDPRSSPPTPG